MNGEHINRGYWTDPDAPIVFNAEIPDPTQPRDFQWAEPPAPSRRGGRPQNPKWPGVAEKLRERPGRWAMVHFAHSRSNADDIARRIKIGGLDAFRPGGSYDATQRSVEGGHEIYAKFIGHGVIDAAG